MKTRDILLISVKNTWRNGRKTLLSSIAVAIGVASLLLISAVGNGAYTAAETELGKLGIDGLSIRLEETKDSVLEPDYADFLEKNVAGISSTMPFKLKYGSGRLLKNSSDAVIWGIGEHMIETMGVRLLHGREITGSDIASNARVAIVDDEYAFSTYRRTNVVGKTVRICLAESWENYEIIGVIASQTEALNALAGGKIGTFLYIPYTTMNENIDEYGVDQIAIRCREDADPGVVASASEQYLSRIHAGEGTFVAENITGYLERVKGIVRLIKLLVTAVGGISLIVAGVGVMNAMLAGIEERRREIGIYLAVGAIPGDIVRNVLLEAILTCLLGGLSGCILGLWGAAAIGNRIGVSCAAGAGEIALALGISCLCGIVSGTVPAIKAAHLDPINALNRE